MSYSCTQLHTNMSYFLHATSHKTDKHVLLCTQPHTDMSPLSSMLLVAWSWRAFLSEGILLGTSCSSCNKASAMLPFTVCSVTLLTVRSVTLFTVCCHLTHCTLSPYSLYALSPYSLYALSPYSLYALSPYSLYALSPYSLYTLSPYSIKRRSRKNLFLFECYCNEYKELITYQSVSV